MTRISTRYDKSTSKNFACYFSKAHYYTNAVFFSFFYNLVTFMSICPSSFFLWIIDSLQALNISGSSIVSDLVIQSRLKWLSISHFKMVVNIDQCTLAYLDRQRRLICQCWTKRDKWVMGLKKRALLCEVSLCTPFFRCTLKRKEIHNFWGRMDFQQFEFQKYQMYV